MNEQLEPRIEKLEGAYLQTAKALVGMERDYKHLTLAVDKMTDLLVQQEANQSAIKSAHHRIDNIDERLSTCQNTKVSSTDFKELKDSLKEVRDSELKNAWLGSLGSASVKLIIVLVVTAVIGLVIKSSGV